MSKPLRHKWSAPVRDRFKTERVCERACCGLIRVTRHEPGLRAWVEWWRASADGAADGERPVKIGVGSPTPPCQGRPAA